MWEWLINFQKGVVGEPCADNYTAKDYFSDKSIFAYCTFLTYCPNSKKNEVMFKKI